MARIMDSLRRFFTLEEENYSAEVQESESVELRERDYTPPRTRHTPAAPVQPAPVAPKHTPAPAAPKPAPVSEKPTAPAKPAAPARRDRLLQAEREWLFGNWRRQLVRPDREVALQQRTGGLGQRRAWLRQWWRG